MIRSLLVISLLVFSPLGCEAKKKALSGNTGPDPSEAIYNLKAIAKGATQAFSNEASPPLFPKAEQWECTKSGGSGEKGSPDALNFQETPWTELKFVLRQPHHFRYCYRSGSAQLSFAAVAEIDGGDVFCTDGTLLDGQPVIRLPEARPSRGGCLPPEH